VSDPYGSALAAAQRRSQLLSQAITNAYGGQMPNFAPGGPPIGQGLGQYAGAGGGSPAQSAVVSAAQGVAGAFGQIPQNLQSAYGMENAAQGSTQQAANYADFFQQTQSIAASQAQAQQQSEQGLASQLFDAVTSGKMTSQQAVAYLAGVGPMYGLGPESIASLAASIGASGSGAGQLPADLQNAVGSLVMDAYGQGKSSLADVGQYVTNVLMSGGKTGATTVPAAPSTYLQNKQAIDAYIASVYQQTNGVYGPGGTSSQQGGAIGAFALPQGFVPTATPQAAYASPQASPFAPSIRGNPRLTGIHP
jgi:hypothetical protein